MFDRANSTQSTNKPPSMNVIEVQHTSPEFMTKLRKVRQSLLTRTPINRLVTTLRKPLYALCDESRYPCGLFSSRRMDLFKSTSATVLTMQIALSCVWLLCCGDHQAREALDTSVTSLPAEISRLDHAVKQLDDAELRDFLKKLMREAFEDEPSSEAIGRLAMAYDANGFDLTAERMYRLAQTLDIDQFKWHYLYAVRLQKNGSLASALDAAQVAIEKKPHDAPIHLRLGNWLLDSGQPKKALQAFQRATDLGIGPAGELGSARTNLKLENYEIAQGILSSVVDRTGHPAALRLLGEVWRQLGDENKARHFLARGARSKSMWFDDPLISEMQTFVKGKRSQLHEIELMLASGLVDQALHALQDLEKSHPADFNIQYHLALAYFQIKRNERARTHLLKTIELEPIHYPSHFLLASLYQQIEDNIKAARHLERVVQIYPKLHLAHQELGYVRLRLGDTVGALASFEAAIALDSVAPNVYYYAGIVMGEQGLCEPAMDKFKTALVLDPTHQKARIALAECQRALQQP